MVEPKFEGKCTVQNAFECVGPWGTKVDTLHVVAGSKRGGTTAINPEFPQNRERRAVGGDHQSSKRVHLQASPFHSSPQKGRSHTKHTTHPQPTAPQSKLCLTCFKEGHPDASLDPLLASDLSLSFSPPSDCISLPSMMTWAPCPHGVRTRGKKSSASF